MIPNSKKNLTIIKDSYKTVCIYRSTIERFMEKNPPCKECLVKTMCIKQDNDGLYNFIRLEICDRFKEFWCKYLMVNGQPL